MKNILNRKTIFSTHSKILLVIVLAVLIVINLISVNHFGRIDLTAEKQYSLSSATKNSLSKIDDPLYIKVYFSQKLPPDLDNIYQYTKDILAEYQAFSNNLKIEFIDPASDEEIKNEALSLGIPEIEMQILEKDQFKIQKGFLGVALLFEDKNEVIPFIESTQNLEYDLTSAIKRLTAESLKSVGFLTGHEEHGLYSSPFDAPEDAQNNDYTTIYRALMQNYKVSTIDLTQGQAITNVDTLIIGGPKTELSTRELYEIDQFIMRGGKAIFLLDQVDIIPGLQAVPIETGLAALLNTYGIQINTDLVMDAKSNEIVAFSSGQMQYFLPYAFWPKLIRQNFDTANPIMAKLQSLSFAWVSSLNTLQKENIETQVLATTTEISAKQSQPFNLDPQQNINTTQKIKIPVIIEAKGMLPSHFAGQEAPAIAVDPETENIPISLSDQSGQTLNTSNQETQIMVIGDSDFIADQQLQRFPDNLAFILNAVDYLTLDSDLINIRAKTITSRPIKTVSESTKTWIKIINIALIPLIIIIIGIINFYLRKKNK